MSYQPQDTKTKAALRWLVNVYHNVGRAGGRPEPGEWEAAVKAGEVALLPELSEREVLQSRALTILLRELRDAHQVAEETGFVELDRETWMAEYAIRNCQAYLEAAAPEVVTIDFCNQVYVCRKCWRVSNKICFCGCLANKGQVIVCVDRVLVDRAAGWQEEAEGRDA